MISRLEGFVRRRVLTGMSRFSGCERANVTIIFGIALIPVLLALGSGLDYGLAMKRQARMNAAADAAVLSAVTPTMMAQPAAVAQASALAFFNTQVSSLTGVSYSASNVTVTVTDTTVNSTIKRTATLTYRGASGNTFASILSIPTLTLKGTSTAGAASAANIDFYLMLDTSPSMAIAATTTDIATMVNATPKQGGCAFACHQTNPAADNLGNPGGSSQDNYALAQSLGVTLRIDLMRQAVQQLMTTAASTGQSNNAVYRMAGYDFDIGTTNIIPLTANLTLAQQQAANIAMLTVYKNGWLTSTNSNNDQDTNFDQAFSTLNGIMPNPGTGTKTPGDSPQEVLFIVTDAVADASSGGNRVFTPMGPSSTWCTTVKNRGIRIAVLYTTYNPLPSNSFYMQNIAPMQSTIAPTAQACASPGLFFQVDTGGNITSAMQALFNAAVASAHLIN